MNSSKYLAKTDLSELARLLVQDKQMTKETRELFLLDEWKSFHTIIDLGCGPGGWLLDAAAQFPQIDFVGIDIDPRVIDYANSLLQAENLMNLTFTEKDAFDYLPSIPDESFDLVHLRDTFTWMLVEQWPWFLEECWRVLRPGGSIWITEYEVSLSNSFAFDELNSLFMRSLLRVKRSFSPIGRSTGITCAMPSLLKNAKFTDIRVKAYAFQVRPEVDGFDVWKEDIILIAKNMGIPLIVAAHLASKEEVEKLMEQLLHEMDQPSFSSLAYHATIFGLKEENE